MKRQCTCLGNNPDCLKCGGWGYIDEIDKGLASAGPALKAPTAPSNLFRRKRKAARPFHRVACPKCGILVTKLDRHLRRAHSETSAQVPVRSDLLKCPHCPALVKASRLSVHIARAHGGEKTNKQAPRLDHSPSNDDASQTDLQSDIKERRLDATREYAHNFRDHGQFGSHPSHDGFDDESNP